MHGASLSIFPVQCVEVSSTFQVSSLSSESVDFGITTPYLESGSVLKTESHGRDENNVSTLADSALGNTIAFTPYSDSEQTVSNTTAIDEVLQDNAGPNFTQTGMPENSSTATMLPRTPSNNSPNTEDTGVTPQGKQVKHAKTFGILITIIVVAIILIAIIVLVVAYLFKQKGKSASYNTESVHEGTPMNEVCTERPNN
ncbi:uncharacterized protein LOC144505092 isoform X2 [Mustelus asterias]